LIKIKMNNDIVKLTAQLKRMRFDLLRSTSEMIVDLSKIVNETLINKIDELVYDQYEPEKYERTMHLRGAHGAKVEDSIINGDIKMFLLYIDENSRDPVDGETWKEKAEKVEKGSSKMTVGFDRPFISETQDALEWEAERLTKALIKKYETIIKRVKV
jgi:hypothetical protein